MSLEGSVLSVDVATNAVYYYSGANQPQEHNARRGQARPQRAAQELMKALEKYAY